MELSEEILKLCLRFRRCKSKTCRRVMRRGTGSRWCPMCHAQNKPERAKFLAWYENEGKRLDDILPNPILKINEIYELLKEIRREKA